MWDGTIIPLFGILSLSCELTCYIISHKEGRRTVGKGREQGIEGGLRLGHMMM